MPPLRAIRRRDRRAGPRAFAAGLAIVLAGVAAGPRSGNESAQADDRLFEIDGTVRAAFVSVTERSESPDPALGPMALRAAGVIATLTPRDLKLLASCEPREPDPIGRPPIADRVGVVHLVTNSGARSVEIIRDPDGLYVAALLGTGLDRPPCAILNRDRFADLSAAWPTYLGGFTPPAEAPGTVVEMRRPYRPGAFVADRATYQGLYMAGTADDLAEGRRDLADETLWVRLPARYDPRTPAGLVVWVDAASADCKPPPELWPACDELNLIAVSAAGTGNNRHFGARCQLACDAAATAMRDYHVDPSRVFVSGISGGGRTASALAGRFPGLFTGCVAIVALSSYDPVPVGTGRYWPARFRKPSGSAWGELRSHRIAAITGPGDYNMPEIEGAARLMRGDGLQTRVFDFPGLAHQMCSADQFAEAIRWVDEPARAARDAAALRAADLLAAYRHRFGDAAPPDRAARDALVRVTAEAPWSAAAWSAVALLVPAGGAGVAETVGATPPGP